MTAFLGIKFPKRKVADQESISLLIKELKNADFAKIGEIDSDLKKGVKALEAYEKETPPKEKNTKGELKDVKYSRVGAIRTSLILSSLEFRSQGANYDDETAEKYAHLLVN